MGKLTLFPKLIVAFMLVIAPLYGLGLLVNKRGETIVRDELARSLQSKVDFYVNALDAEKEHMVKLLQMNTLDKDLQHYALLNEVMSIGERAEAVRRIESNLDIVKSSSLYIKSVSAHILSLDRTLSTEYSITDHVAGDYEALRPAFAGQVSAAGMTIVDWHDRLFIGLGFPEPSFNRQPEFVLSIELDPDRFRGLLSGITDYDQSGALLYNPQRSWSLSQADGAPEHTALRAYLSRQYEAGKLAGMDTVKEGGETYLVTYRYSDMLGFYLSVYVPYREVFGQIEVYRTFYWGLSLISSIIIVVYSYWLYRLIHKPLRKLIRSFRRVEDGNLDPAPLPSAQDEFHYLFRQYNTMVEKLKVLITQVYEQKIRAQRSELKQLQSQINPHFLYNTYFILYRLARINDNQSIARFSQFLGDYFRYITRSASADVPLEAELRHVRTYAEIQNIRFSNRIQVEIDPLPESCAKQRVPRLILQPILENAYKYGLENKRSDGKIALRIEQRGDTVRIEVEDNGTLLTDETLRRLQDELAQHDPEVEQTGLLNVHRRIRLTFGARSGIRLSRGAMGGLCVELALEMTTAEPLPATFAAMKPREAT
ncbi:MAG: sensor histidine kinase [Paenibacillaceae bacterium]|nr:sensor histidine kinase [Paenibacillaceae bacterium]